MGLRPELPSESLTGERSVKEYLILRSFCNDSHCVTLDDLDSIVGNFYAHPDFVVPVRVDDEGDLDKKKADMGRVSDVRRCGVDLFAASDVELPPGFTLIAQVYCTPPKECGGEGMMLRCLNPLAKDKAIMEWDK